MKLKLAILSSVAAIIVAASAEFCREVWPGPGIMFITGFTRMAILGLLVVAFVFVLRLWRRYSFGSLIPLAVLIVFVGGCGHIQHSARQIARKRFLSRIGTFERVVEDIRSGTVLRDRRYTTQRLDRNGPDALWVKLPSDDGYIGYAAVSETDTNGVLSVRFMQSVIFNGHHDKYLYRSDGNMEAALFGRETITYRINTNWCAVAD